MKLAKRLVLASASPRRRALMAEAGYTFDVVPADVDESLPQGFSPEAAAVEVARRKAVAVAANVNNAIILAADTIVVTPSGEIAGKPADEADARRMLRSLSNSTHRVITGVYILDCDTGASMGRAGVTKVIFGGMTDVEIDEYVGSGEAMGKAGAYAIQETGDRFVKSVEGSFSNVVGLPMEAVADMLRAVNETGADERR
jgi:septum formation protein